MDMLRQTGRTTRMVDKVYNDYMSGITNPLIVMANDYDVRIAQARLQWLNATVAANIIVVTYGEAAEMRVDLDTFSHPDYTVFIDHDRSVEQWPWGLFSGAVVVSFKAFVLGRVALANVRQFRA